VIKNYRLGWVSQKHASFPPVMESQLGFRLRSPLFGEEPYPLKPSNGFINTHPSS